METLANNKQKNNKVKEEAPVASKKSKRWNHPVRDKLEEVFCIKKSKFVRPGYIFREADPEQGIKKIVEAQKFDFNGKKFTENYLENKVVIAIRPNNEIKVFVLDIDSKSKYRNDYGDLIGCLEDIGFCKCIRVISSSSGGLHLWFPISIALNSKFLHVSIKAWLEYNGFEVKDGTLEIFPGLGQTTYHQESGKWEKTHLARCFRLPCQEGSFVVDEDENILHNSIERFWLEEFDWCAERQDYDTFNRINTSIQITNNGFSWKDDLLVTSEEEELKRREVERDAPPKRTKKGRISRVEKEQKALSNKLKELGVSRNQYIASLRELIKEGWTSPSQSNYLIGAVAVVASYDNRTLSEAELAKVILWEVKRMPGFTEYASDATKKDLEKINKDSWARRWAKSVIKYRKNKLGLT